MASSAHDTKHPPRRLEHHLDSQTPPNEADILFKIGHYQVLSTIGKGGMGVVYLAYDPSCGRRIAIKKIRKDLQDFKQIHARFLKEATIASQLTHPSIIPIYSIYSDGKEIYYTMPYIQGETLKEILKKARLKKAVSQKNREGSVSSIPSLIRVLISIAQAIAYAHSHQVLHRDIKPENIIIGHFGEVMILDWGLATIIGKASEDVAEKTIVDKAPGITKAGKVAGTINYMAPERALGKHSSQETDIYSLGVILYQMLTLKLPFRRTSLKEYREKMQYETITDPQEASPYRDIPRLLSRIALKCLERDPRKRYQKVDGLIHDLENYIEGRAEWSLSASLNTKNRDDWEFQENVFLAEHVAVTRAAEVSDWMNLMISKTSFAGNVRVEAEVRLGSSSHGIGFLLSVPEPSERRHLNDGFCLWLGSVLNRSTKLLRSTVEVIHATDIILKRHLWYKLRIDKIDHNIYFYLNDKLLLSYVGHLPLVGTHIGIVSRDAEYDIKNLVVYTAGQNVMVKCLAVPDAFLAHKQYQSALAEYRRIGYSFPGRQEGREAMFRAGITLLEEAKGASPDMREATFDLSLLEFEKLHDTPGAPLEYLGKALVYQTLEDTDEEIKCFELAFRRYSGHPLLPVLNEQLIYRMHEASRYQRKTTYDFILLTLRFVPNILKNNNALKLFHSLEKHWEPLQYTLPLPKKIDTTVWTLNFSSLIAFWLGKDHILEEIAKEAGTKEPASPPQLLFNIWILMLRNENFAALQSLLESYSPSPDRDLFLKAATLMEEKAFAQVLALIDLKSARRLMRSLRIGLIALDKLLLMEENDFVIEQCDAILRECRWQDAILLDERKIWALLQKRSYREAGEVFKKYPVDYLGKEECPLFSLYGCWLSAVEEGEIAYIHFSGTLEHPFPKSWTLLGHHLGERKTDQDIWLSRAFSYEKKQLFRQLALYYRCIEDKIQEAKWRSLSKELEG